MAGFENKVATVTLNRPQALNSFTAALHRALLAGVFAAPAGDTQPVDWLVQADQGFQGGAEIATRVQEASGKVLDKSGRRVVGDKEAR